MAKKQAEITFAPGPWTVRKPYYDCGRLVQGAVYSVDADGKPIEKIGEFAQHEYALRAANCVNACEGIPEEQLQLIPVFWHDFIRGKS